MKDFIVTDFIYNGKKLTAAAFYDNSVLEELEIEDAARRSYTGCVFSGTVEQVSRNIGGAFIRIGNYGKAVNAGILKEHAADGRADLVFLPLKKKRIPQVSSRILIQIRKDAVGIKEAVCTENIQVAGRYSVVKRFPGPVSFSARLTAEQKNICAKWLSDLDAPYQIVVRTNAARASKEDFLKELRDLITRMDRILEHFSSSDSYKKLYEPDPFYRILERDLFIRPDRYLTDRADIAEADERYNLVEKPGRTLPLYELYNLPRDLDRLTSKTVWMKSGGFIVIEKTEAFVSVDVNTGRCEKGRIPEETYRTINLEAAGVLADQIRLRNLSGMILVDFINLSSTDHREELVNTMKKLVKKDHVRTEVVDLTPLGIMELVREKHRRPLSEIL